MFESLPLESAESILELLSAFQQDNRDDKVDLGIGVYRDESGNSPIMKAVKAAERQLLTSQNTKAYLGPEGDPEFLRELGNLIWGHSSRFPADRAAAIQTPGASGALRLATDLVSAFRPSSRILLGLPTWVNHAPLFAASGLRVIEHRYSFEQVAAAWNHAQPGDLAVIQACCHNPTGIDLTTEQWRQLTSIVLDRGIVPLVDLAYHGLGEGLEPDTAGVRYLLDHAEEAFIAYSCSKNFGLYRERTGALFALCRDNSCRKRAQSQLSRLARTTWSMPPDHGAAVVRTILQSPNLSQAWTEELDTCRIRVQQVRRQLSLSHPAYAHLAEQKGWFWSPNLKPGAAQRLRHQGFYLPDSGRINLAGLRSVNLRRFADTLFPELSDFETSPVPGYAMSAR